MFSQAGKPWSRALVRQLPPNPGEVPTDTLSLDSLPGEAFPLARRDISQNDVSDYVSKTRTWTAEHIRGLRSIFERGAPLDAPLLILRARGSLIEDSVHVQVVPTVLLTQDSTYFPPSIKPVTSALPNSAAH